MESSFVHGLFVFIRGHAARSTNLLLGLLMQFFLVLLLLSALGAATAVHAFDSIDDYKNFELAVVKALEMSPSVNAAQHELAAMEAEYKQTRARLFPAVQFQAYGGETSTEYQNKSSDFFVNNRSTNESRMALTLTQPLFKPVFLGQMSLAEISIAQARAKAEFEGLQFELRVIQAIADYWKSAGLKRLSRSQYEDAAEKERVSEYRKIQGALKPYEASLSSSAAKLAIAELNSSRNDEARRLHNLLSLAPTIDVIPPPSSLLLKPLEEIDEWIDVAIQKNPEVLVAAAGVEIAKKNLEISDSENKPTLDLTARVAQERPNSIVSRGLYSESSTWAMGLELNVPIYSGGSSKFSEAKARSRVAKAEHELNYAQKQVESTVIDAYSDAYAAMEHAKAQARQIDSFRHEERTVVNALKTGAALRSDLLAVQVKLTKAIADYREKQYLAWTALARLYAVAGCRPRHALSMAEGSCINKIKK